MDSNELAGALARLATGFQDAPNQALTVDAIVTKAVETIPDVEDASITIRTGRRYSTLASTSEMALAADELQYTLDQGPCIGTADHVVDWMRSGEVRSDRRWPAWGPRAATLGVGSLLSVALYARGDWVGALNLYSGETGRFNDQAQVEYALLFAVHSAHALSGARLVHGLEVAASSRHIIGAAQGIVMERYGLSLDQAFELMRRISMQTNVKLAEIARAVVDTGTVPGVGTEEL